MGVNGSGDNITFLINNADTAGVQSFNAGGLGDKLVTAGSTLDLSHTTVSGFTVASTNGVGTTFTVGDLGTAFQVAGGSGHDTLIAQGLTLTADQRAAIFPTSSIETITDQSGTYAANTLNVNEAPTAVALANTTASIAENTSTASHIKVADINVTDDALGSNTLGLTGTDAGFFEIAGNALYLKAGTVLDFESKSSYAVAVTVDDPTVGATPDATSATYTLNVSNVNEAPTAVALANTTASIAENTSTASHIKVADINVTDDALGSNTLGLTGTDAGFFEIAGNALYLKAGTVLDFESKSSYAVAVTVDDPTVGGTPDATSTTYTLNVSNVNEAPTAVALANTTASIAENTSTASHIKVADINVTDDALGSNTLGLTGTDAGFFEIAGNALYLKAGTVLDFESKSSYAVAVTVDDPTVGGTPDATSTTYTLNVSNVNEAPTAVALANTTASIAENTSTASHIKVADINVTDDALGSNTLGLTGTDAAFFEIAGNALYLKSGTVLDFESKSSYAVAVTVDDPTVGGTPDATSTTYTLNVSNVNEAPTFNNINQQLTNDTGSSHVDRITMDGHVTLSGAVSDANGVSVVEIFDGNTDLGPATLSNGHWTFSTVLGAGNHALDAVATDVAGNTTTSATQPIIKVDNTGPTITISQHLANDTGISNTDGITRDGHVSLSGTVSDANGVAGIEIYDGTTDLGAATITQIGQWTFSTLLAQGPHALDAVATDVAGNTTTTATQHSILVDTTPPVPVMLDAINNTSNTLTTLGGTSEASSSVSIYDSNKLIGTTTADANGNWNFQAKVTGNPIHSYTETATDLAGNVGSSTGSTIYATSSNKTLLGGTGNDVLVAAPKDTLTGGLGSDTFVFNPSFGKVTVSDFNANIDTLAFDHNLFSNAAQVLSQAHDTSAGVVITVDALDGVTLTGVHVADLQNHQSAFHFF